MMALTFHPDGTLFVGDGRSGAAGSDHLARNVRTRYPGVRPGTTLVRMGGSDAAPREAGARPASDQAR